MNYKSYSKKSYVNFTFLFIVLAPLCFIQFLIYGKSFLVADGIHEHTAFLAFYGSWLREIILNFLHGDFKIPTYSFSFGFGADIISTMGNFCMGDPFNLVAIFFPKSAAYFLFVFLAFVRLWLLGISFIFYCKKRGFDSVSATFGAIAYSLCGYAVFIGVRHPYFLNPMIYLPFLCLGIDNILEKKKPYLFIISVFISCASNYYWFYMLSVFIFIYALVRFFFTGNEINFKSFLYVFLKTLGFYFIGVAMAAFMLLPNIYGFLTASRTTEKINVPLLYNFNYYGNLFFSPAAPSSFGSYGVLGFAAPLFLTAVFIFAQKDKISLQLKIFITIGLLFYCIPYVAHFMNGFNYLSNRWNFAFAFPICLAFAYGFPLLCKSSKKDVFIPCTIVLVHNIIILAACLFSSNIRRQYMLCYLFSLVFIVLFFILISKKCNLKAYVFAMVSIGVLLNATIRFSPYGLNYLEKYKKSGIFAGNFNSSTDSEILKLPENDFFRYDEEDKFTANNTVMFGTHGTNYYYSLSDIHLTELYEETALAQTTELTCGSLNRRNSLQNLFDVRYYVLPSDSNYIPSNMVFIKEFNTYGGRKKLYKLNGNNKFAVSYKKTFSSDNDKFKNLSPLEKQELFTRYAVIYDNREKEKNIEPDFLNLGDIITKGKIELSYKYGTIIDGRKFIIDKTNSQITVNFSFENKDSTEKELYLLLKNIHYKTESDEKVKCKVAFAKDAKTDSVEFEIGSDNDNVGHNRMPCFGLQNCDDGKFYISFDHAGTYSFDDISVYALDISEGRTSDIDVQNCLLGTNTVRLDVNLPEKEFVRFSVPYSKGWKIYVDGQESKKYRCDAAFPGAFVEKGQHNIELVYHTPFLSLGCIISLAGVILFASMLILNHKNKQ